GVQGRHRAARRALSRAGGPDAAVRGGAGRDAAVLDRGRARGGHRHHRGAARDLRRATHRGRQAGDRRGAPRHLARPQRRPSEGNLIVPQPAARAREIAPAQGKLGVLLVGLGAVSTTFIAGVENVRRGRALPIGSLTQMSTIRLGRRPETRAPKIKDFAPLAGLQDLVLTAGCDRLVMVWCASTEVFITPGPAHQSLAAFEKAMEQNDPAIAPSMLYAWAALMEGVPFANGAPNLTVDVPALEKLAEERHLPI